MQAAVMVLLVFLALGLVGLATCGPTSQEFEVLKVSYGQENFCDVVPESPGQFSLVKPGMTIRQVGLVLQQAPIRTTKNADGSEEHVYLNDDKRVVIVHYRKR